MKYYEVKFSVKPYSEDACDILSSLLADLGFETFIPIAQGITGYIQQTLFEESSLQQLCRDFILPGFSITYKTEEAPDEDWNQTWEKEGFEPIAIDHLVCVHDTRHTEVPLCQYDITINPRMAFGTGSHPTTQQILRQLCNMELQGKRIVDAGCGTGVLGFLSSMRGALHIFSYDIDEWSVENTRINAALNGVSNITITRGDASVLPQDQSYDLLIANINRNILLADMPRFATTLKAEAQLLLSGFYETDVPLLIEKGKEAGFRLVRQTISDGWAMLLLGR